MRYHSSIQQVEKMVVTSASSAEILCNGIRNEVRADTKHGWACVPQCLFQLITNSINYRLLWESEASQREG